MGKIRLKSVILSIVLLFTLCVGTPVFTKTPDAAGKAVAEEGAYAVINYSSTDGNAFDGTEQENVSFTTAEITGVGTYTVSIDLSATARASWKGVSFLAVQIVNGAELFPDYTVRVWGIEVNGSPLEGLAKGFTYDVGNDTFADLYATERTGTNVRTYDKQIATANDSVFTPDQVEEYLRRISTLEIEFSVIAPDSSADYAYLMFCDNSFIYPYNTLPGLLPNRMVNRPAYILGDGEYSVGLDFEEEKYYPQTIKFISLNVLDGQSTFPAYTIKLKSFKVNGTEIAVTKGYTCDSATADGDGNNGRDGTRYYLFHGWLDEIEKAGSPRSYDGSLEGASPRIVESNDFVTVNGTGGDAYLTFAEPIYSIDVTFEFAAIEGNDVDAYITFADGDSDNIYQGDGAPYNTEGITVTKSTFNKAGFYSVGLDFTSSPNGHASGLSVFGIVVEDGENEFEGYDIIVSEIYVNGVLIDFLKDDAGENLKGPTYPKENFENGTNDIRYDIYNVLWSTLPDGARTPDRKVKNCKNKTVDVSDFETIETITVVFQFMYGTLADSQFDPSEYLGLNYNAYLNLSTENYIFRNEWYEATYGLNGEYPDRFYALTGWDQEKDGLDLPPDERWIDYGGEFTDVEIDGNGTFAVSLKIGPMGFGQDTYFRVLNVNTDIPSQLFDEGYVDFTDVVTYLDDQAEKTYFYVSTEKDYINIVILSEYVNAVGMDSISYAMPHDTIMIKFTVSGLEKDSEHSGEITPPTPTDSGTPSDSGSNSSTSGRKSCSGGLTGASSVAFITILGALFLAKKRKD